MMSEPPVGEVFAFPSIPGQNLPPIDLVQILNAGNHIVLPKWAVEEWSQSMLLNKDAALPSGAPFVANGGQGLAGLYMRLQAVEEWSQSMLLNKDAALPSGAPFVANGGQGLAGLYMRLQAVEEWSQSMLLNKDAALPSGAPFVANGGQGLAGLYMRLQAVEEWSQSMLLNKDAALPSGAPFVANGGQGLAESGVRQDASAGASFAASAPVGGPQAPPFQMPQLYPRPPQSGELPAWSESLDLSDLAGTDLEPAMRFQPQEAVPISKLFQGYEDALSPDSSREAPPPDTTEFAPIHVAGETVDRAAFFHQQPTAGSVQGLVCLVCREESTEGTGTCQEQRAMDCSAQYPPGTPTFCFTRDSRLSSGVHVVEKLCVSDYALQVEYGEGAGKEGCEEVWGGRVKYCVCAADKCNEGSVFEDSGSAKASVSIADTAPNADWQPVKDAPVAHQPNTPPPKQLPIPPPPKQKQPQPQPPATGNKAAMQPIQTLLGSPATPPPDLAPPPAPEPEIQPPAPPPSGHMDLAGLSGGLELSSRTNVLPPQGQSPTGPHLPEGQKCFVCGESNLVNTTDCETSYEYDCSIQYPNEPQPLCLTRLTRLENEEVAIEKRCITAAQHREQYPGNDVVMEGCGAAWNDYVQYCVCSGHLCNTGSLSTQQASAKPPVSPTTLPPGHSYLRSPGTHIPPKPTTQTATRRQSPGRSPQGPKSPPPRPTGPRRMPTTTPKRTKAGLKEGLSGRKRLEQVVAEQTATGSSSTITISNILFPLLLSSLLSIAL